jgi:predicted DNA-binding antitoxin AbrB/MazE fold protein
LTQKVDAIYTGGVLKPTRDLCLRENQRVRLIVETIEEPDRDRAAAIARLKAGIASMRSFRRQTFRPERNCMIAGDSPAALFVRQRL